MQQNDKETKLFRDFIGLPEDWEDVEGVLQYWRLPYVSEIIRSELISRHHNNFLARHFDIGKTRELVGQKYYWLSLKKDVETYIIECDIILALKPVHYKLYRDLQSFLVPIYRWKNFSMDFVTGLSLSADWNSDSYDSILVIVDQLTKMVHYKPVKVTIDAPGPAEVILNMVVWYYGLPDSIVTDKSSFIFSKFWSLLCSFLRVKWRLSTTFQPQTDCQIKRQNSIMKAYLKALVNFEQNDWARLLPIAKFAYNKPKNVSIGHTSFKLNCSYHPWMSYKEDVDPRS